MINLYNEKPLDNTTHLFNILIAKVMERLKYKCKSQHKKNKKLNREEDARVDASKRRLTLLLISIVKCFNKQLIIRSKKQSRHFKLAKEQCVDRDLPCHQCAQLPYNATLH